MMNTPTKALFDLSVLVEALNGGGEEGPDSIAALQLVASGQIAGYLSAASVDELNDILTRSHGTPSARSMILELRAMLDIAPVDATVVDAAMALGWNYLDDALTHECARVNGLDRLVTLNPTDFTDASLTVLAPGELIEEMLQARRLSARS
ncbi:type II toxin-antitoxin system VapC family toxin [Imhoffiella purpurea]|uniref:PIN domain protein n=1 Tax=Imhoffiella purpurea TaxID=1249627 RepID=W9VCH9_9GAMM|nr:PIN domain-containing protein [Imhoffiella purpurea]EXJ13742.1 PIN domain protein [Imhoffiella purpurea]